MKTQGSGLNGLANVKDLSFDVYYWKQRPRTSEETIEEIRHLGLSVVCIREKSESVRTC